MRQFKNNLKRNRSRNYSDRSFKRVPDVDRLNGNFSNNDNSFRRKINRNNGNVQKLITNTMISQEKLYRMEIKYYQKIIFSMQTIF